MTEPTPSTLPENWAPRFFTIWTGQAFSLFGSQLVQFALIWWLTQQTGSATVLAIATFVGLLPQVLLGPFAGTFVDRTNRRLVMIVADSAIALATLVLILLFWSGQVQVWQVYLILLLRSAGGAFQSPAMSASTSLMVPQQHLTRVAGANQALSGIMNVVAPPVGALLIGLVPMQQVLLVDIVTAALAVLPLLFIPIPQPPHPAGASRNQPATSFLDDFRAGLRYVMSWPGLLAILIMATLINFILTPAGSLLPLLVTKHFGLGALQLGWVESAFGAGFIAGGLLLSAWGGFRRRIATTLLGISGLGVGTLLVGLAPANLFVLALVGMLLTGLMNPIANGPLFAVLQSSVRPEMQGRVFSLINSLATAMALLSLLVAGPISDGLGIRVWYWTGGSLCILMGLAGFFIPVVMNVESNRSDAGPAVQPAIE